MTATTPKSTGFPVRGTRGGWRDIWDNPDDTADSRAEVETLERHILAQVARIGRDWRWVTTGESGPRCSSLRLCARSQALLLPTTPTLRLEPSACGKRR